MNARLSWFVHRKCRIDTVVGVCHHSIRNNATICNKLFKLEFPQEFRSMMGEEVFQLHVATPTYATRPMFL